MRTVVRMLGLVVPLTLVVSPVLADVIELKTGQRVGGIFKAGTPANISVEVASQTLTIEVDKVRAIYFGAAPVALSSAAQTSPHQEAVKALKGLHSVVQGGWFGWPTRWV